MDEIMYIGMTPEAFGSAYAENRQSNYLDWFNNEIAAGNWSRDLANKPKNQGQVSLRKQAEQSGIDRNEIQNAAQLSELWLKAQTDAKLMKLFGEYDAMMVSNGAKKVGWKKSSLLKFIKDGGKAKAKPVKKATRFSAKREATTLVNDLGADKARQLAEAILAQLGPKAVAA
jgi:hypothetical protein